MSDNSKAGFGKMGFERRNVKVFPLGDTSVEDVIQQIYEYLHQSGYALLQGDYHGQKMMVVCKMHESVGLSFKFEPKAQMTFIIPEYSKLQPQPKGAEFRLVGGGEPPRITS